MAFFEELAYWSKAKELTLAIYELMRDNKDFGFRDQIQRASVSIMNNIAEGSENGTPQSFIRFLNIARGSCAEVRSMLYLCAELKYCTPEKSKELVELCRIVSAAIVSHIKYLKGLVEKSA